MCVQTRLQLILASKRDFGEFFFFFFRYSDRNQQVDYSVAFEREVGTAKKKKKFGGGGGSLNTYQLQRENPLYWRLRGGWSPQGCITQDSQPNTLLTELLWPHDHYQQACCAHCPAGTGHMEVSWAGDREKHTALQLQVTWRSAGQGTERNPTEVC